MTQVRLQPGLLLPDFNYGFLGASNAVIDAATEKIAWIGRLYLNGGSGTKTLSTGTIQFRTGTCTFANGSTTLDIGIQDVATGAGPLVQPDGTFDVKVTLTGGGGGITSGAWNTVTMNTGTKTVSHGDLIAIVFDMTARAGVDSVILTQFNNPGYVSGNSGTSGLGFPTTNVFISSAWQTTQTVGSSRWPNGIIVFDDGTLGWLDGTRPVSTVANDTFQDLTNPDERGMMFQVPFDCKVDAMWFFGGSTDAASDFSLKLYSDPTGTPGSLATINVLSEQLGGANAAVYHNVHMLASQISLSKNTNYAVTMRATGTTNSILANNVLGNTAHRAAWPGTTTLAKVSRQNDTGAFSAESPATTMYQIGVRISSLDDGIGNSGVQLINSQGLVG